MSLLESWGHGLAWKALLFLGGLLIGLPFMIPLGVTRGLFLGMGVAAGMLSAVGGIASVLSLREIFEQSTWEERSDDHGDPDDVDPRPGIGESLSDAALFAVVAIFFAALAFLALRFAFTAD